MLESRGKAISAVTTHVRCVNPQCSNYDLWKSVARVKAAGGNPNVCSLCGGPMKVAKEANAEDDRGSKTRSKKI
jgi:hypothetical protein